MLEIIIEIIVASITVGGALWSVARWTAKVERASDAIDRLTDAFTSFTEKVQGTLTDHEVRITVLEKTQADK